MFNTSVAAFKGKNSPETSISVIVTVVATPTIWAPLTSSSIYLSPVLFVEKSQPSTDSASHTTFCFETITLTTLPLSSSVDDPYVSTTFTVAAASTSSHQGTVAGRTSSESSSTVQDQTWSALPSSISPRRSTGQQTAVTQTLIPISSFTTSATATGTRSTGGSSQSSPTLPRNNDFWTKIRIILGSTLSVAALIILAVLIWYFLLRRKRRMLHNNLHGGPRERPVNSVDSFDATPIGYPPVSSLLGPSHASYLSGQLLVSRQTASSDFHNHIRNCVPTDHSNPLSGLAENEHDPGHAPGVLCMIQKQNQFSDPVPAPFKPAPTVRLFPPSTVLQKEGSPASTRTSPTRSLSYYGSSSEGVGHHSVPSGENSLGIGFWRDGDYYQRTPSTGSSRGLQACHENMRTRARSDPFDLELELSSLISPFQVPKPRA
ncbi:hypothetical protein MPDQ_004189 [Monascus purpureus]|uniref:Mid2 domain-containing protein n=1 Tax=Monascus purpureus TaxID=5098 RepID=A0A507QK50_MONPU|nr:hypothetical protein MPDQ_004189 [Monascus purpureus]BDD63157.1 hypothetical protein MAP00_008090 [Monascus purpureus]